MERYGSVWTVGFFWSELRDWAIEIKKTVKDRHSQSHRRAKSNRTHFRFKASYLGKTHRRRVQPPESRLALSQFIIIIIIIFQFQLMQFERDEILGEKKGVSSALHCFTSN